ncbi:hypothetical protein HK097_004294 [Rhizophlyctis rosea]|uniref:Hexosyltransferase n=1 Tax=Rhizophlyctis rosea TaxID=64517 RepID=A0AAD5S2U0_9FUNG|nr:hypothetical protein HK097_004294 [Rhizophlyctis rosea]
MALPQHNSYATLQKTSYSTKSFNTIHRTRLFFRNLPARNRLLHILLTLGLIQCLYWALNPSTFPFSSSSSSSSERVRKSTTQERLGKWVGGQKTVLVGVLTVPGKFERRSLIRATYLQSKPDDVDFYFVVCRVGDVKLRTLLTVEQRRFGDIVEVDCEENMDSGKTWSYFHHLSTHILHPTPSLSPYLYIMKTDDDVYLNLPLLSRRLLSTPRLQTFYGRQVPQKNFMAGMGYVLSTDLAYWIGTDPIPASKKIGQEDALLASWLHRGKMIRNWVSDEEGFIDHPGSGKGWAKDFDRGSTVLVHRCKDEGLFLSAARFFMGVGEEGDVGRGGRGMLSGFDWSTGTWARVKEKANRVEVAAEMDFVEEKRDMKKL